MRPSSRSDNPIPHPDFVSPKKCLGSDLAAIYGVTTNAINQTVKRNASRFPANFLFQLPIDYVLTNAGFETLSFKRTAKTSADHWGIFAELKLSK